MDAGSQITTIVKDQVEILAVLKGLELLIQTPDVFFFRLTLPCEDWDAGSSNGGSGMILCGENVAGSSKAISTTLSSRSYFSYDQVTSAPRDVNVSISTAVWIAEFPGQWSCRIGVSITDSLMCRHPAIRAPLSGWSEAYFFLVSINPGISCSAISISRRPKAARDWVKLSAPTENMNPEAAYNVCDLEFARWCSV